jgi:hypothetical protein
VGAGFNPAAVTPGLAVIELSDHLDHAVTAGVELPRQEGEFIAEFFIYTGSVRGGGSSGIGHGGTCTTVIMSSNLVYACELRKTTVSVLFYGYFRSTALVKKLDEVAAVRHLSLFVMSLFHALCCA